MVHLLNIDWIMISCLLYFAGASAALGTFPAFRLHHGPAAAPGRFLALGFISADPAYEFPHLNRLLKYLFDTKYRRDTYKCDGFQKYSMDRKCPVYRVLEFIGKRWTLLIILELYKGRARWKRYARIKERLPDITPKILSARLRELEREKLIRRRVDAGAFPIKSEYSLTRSGEDLLNIIRGMKEWGLKWKVKNEHCKNTNCKYCRL
jgi:DNA-binding HxlR family transcriptional regulator